MEVIDFTTEHLEKLKEHEVKIENNIKEIKEIEHKVDNFSDMKENLQVLHIFKRSKIYLTKNKQG